MATPSLNLNYTVLSDCDTLTGWDDGALEPDIKKQGTNALVTAIRDGGTVTFTPAAAQDMSATDTHLRLWFFHSFAGDLELKANGGIQLFVSDGTNTNYYYVGGVDTHEGSWELMQANLAAPDVDGGVNLASVTSAGFVLVHANAARNLDNTWWDYFVFGQGYEVKGGTSGDPVTWASLAAHDASQGLGMVQEVNGVYFINGELVLGDQTNGTTDLFFDGSNEVAVFYERGESSTLYKIVGNGGGATNCDISITGTVIKSASSPFGFDMSSANVTAFSLQGSTIAVAAAVTFAAGQTVTGDVFDACGQIDPSTATFEGFTIKNYTGNEGGALLWPGGTTVRRGTFDNNAPNIEVTQTTNQTYDDITFENEDDVTKQATHLNNGGVDIDISKNNGSNPQFYTATGGGVVTYVGASVTVLVRATDVLGQGIENVNVLLMASDGTGPFPYQEAVTITRAGTTATVSHTAHGMATGDKIRLRGITDKTEDNTIHTITVIDADSYSYQTTDSGSTTYQGTITATFVALQGLTDVNGEITTSRVYPSAQPVTGWARKSTSSPYYKQGIITGDVSSTDGFSSTTVMISDE